MPHRHAPWAKAAVLATLLISLSPQAGAGADQKPITERSLGVAYPVISSTYDSPRIQALVTEPRAQVMPVHKTPPIGVRSGDDFRPAIKQYGGFIGIEQTPWRPPDPTIAVGPNHIMQTVNLKIAWWTKGGSLQYSVPLDSSGFPGFFEDVGAGAGLFDPKCLYDESTGRFFVVVLEAYSNTAYITFAVSDDSDPNGVWYKYRTEAVTWVGANSYWIDYPGLGVDDQAFYVTGNLFGLNNGGWAGVKYRVVPKSDVLAGNPLTYIDLRDPNSASVQAAHVHDASTPPYFMSVLDSTHVRMQSLTNPTTSPSLHTRDLAVSFLAAPPTVPTLGGGNIDAMDARIINAYCRNGLVYAAHGIRSGSRSIARWYEVRTNGWPQTGSPAVTQEGEVDLGGGISTFFPALARNTDGQVAMIMARGAGSEYPSIWYTMRQPGDPLGTMRPPLELKAGESGYNASRWGDYFDVAIDPADDLAFWGTGEYTTGTSYWSTYIGTLGFNPSSITYIGSGSPGSAGITPQLSVDQAVIAASTTLSVSASIGGVPYQYVLGSAQGSLWVGGCEVYVAWPWLVTASMTMGGLPWAGYGQSDITFLVPDDPSLMGITLYLQALIMDSGAPAGLSATPAASLTFGDI